jgi:CheY-like chemotaxis protein
MLLNFINDIIDISLIESGQITLKPTPINIQQMFNELFDNAKEKLIKAGKEHVELMVNLPEIGLQDIFSDYTRLRQIFGNLINNAINNTDNGLICFGYKFEANNSLNFFVKDTGRAIPKERQEKLFTHFGNLPDSRTAVDYKPDLGLPIAYNLTKLLGGELSFVTDEKLGNEFVFSHPLQSANMYRSFATIGINYFDKLLHKTLLIAEEEEIDYLYFYHILQHTPIELKWVKNGFDALNALRNQEKIDFMLLDCNIPLMNGMDTYREIKKIHPELPIIMQNHKLSPEALSKLHCDAIIEKPISKEDFIETLGSLL